MVKGRWSVLPSPLSLPQDETTGPDWFPPYSLPLGTAKAKATQKEGRRKEQHGNTTNLLSSSLKAQLKALRSPRFALRVLVSRRLVSRLPWRRTSRRSRASSCRTRACRRGNLVPRRRSDGRARHKGKGYVRSFVRSERWRLAARVKCGSLSRILLARARGVLAKLSLSLI